MLKTILISTALLGTLAGNAFAIEIPCNPAVQNWANGSNMTCPSAGGGSQMAQRSTNQNTPPTIVIVSEIPADTSEEPWSD